MSSSFRPSSASLLASRAVTLRPASMATLPVLASMRSVVGLMPRMRSGRNGMRHPSFVAFKVMLS